MKTGLVARQLDERDYDRFKAQLGGDLVMNWLMERPPTLRYRLRRKAKPLIKLAKSIARRAGW